MLENQEGQLHPIVARLDMHKLHFDALHTPSAFRPKWQGVIVHAICAMNRATEELRIC